MIDRAIYFAEQLTIALRQLKRNQNDPVIATTCAGGIGVSADSALLLDPGWIARPVACYCVEHVNVQCRVYEVADDVSRRIVAKASELFFNGASKVVIAHQRGDSNA